MKLGTDPFTAWTINNGTSLIGPSTFTAGGSTITLAGADFAVTPEPGSLMLCASGVAAALGMRRRRRAEKSPGQILCLKFRGHRMPPLASLSVSLEVGHRSIVQESVMPSLRRAIESLTLGTALACCGATVFAEDPAPAKQSVPMMGLGGMAPAKADDAAQATIAGDGKAETTLRMDVRKFDFEGTKAANGCTCPAAFRSSPRNRRA